MTPNKTQQDSVTSPKSRQQVTRVKRRIEDDRQLIMTAHQKGKGAVLKTYMRLSGPGWLQSGITIGGATFSSSLYLGILSGFTFLWLQPLYMILGIVMLAAIAYVTLSTGQRPLKTINSHVSPVLGWGWLFATMAANLVWSMPQFTLATRSIQQNLLPNLVGPQVLPDPWGRVVVVCFLLVICITVTMFYGAGARGVKIFEVIIKAMVSMIVLCFFAVILKLAFKEGGMNWGQVLRGLIPNPHMLFRPAEGLTPYLQAVTENCRAFWTNLIVRQQNAVMISALAATVGVNMTFLFPYSMMRRGWDKDFRALAIFDLSTGLFIPFALASSFVVMASASRFYTVPEPGFVPDNQAGTATVMPADNLVGQYKTLLKQRLAFEIGNGAAAALSAEQLQQRTDALPYADKRMAAMLVKRDNINLADTLTPLTGKVVSQYLFGLGVMGLGLSAATVLMTINGLCLCELLGRPPKGWTHRIGALIVSVGALGAIFWEQPAPWLAMPTSAFCSILLPIAYITFLILMNQKSTLGDSMPRGGRRILWNVLMGLATIVATFISMWSLWAWMKAWSIVITTAFAGLVLVVHFARKKKTA
jgi:Mn2+/Fe2+ NRAMP family transporter